MINTPTSFRGGSGFSVIFFPFRFGFATVSFGFAGVSPAPLDVSFLVRRCLPTHLDVSFRVRGCLARAFGCLVPGSQVSAHAFGCLVPGFAGVSPAPLENFSPFSVQNYCFFFIPASISRYFFNFFFIFFLRFLAQSKFLHYLCTVFHYPSSNLARMIYE